jgi:hypothetical protein
MGGYGERPPWLLFIPLPCFKTKQNSSQISYKNNFFLKSTTFKPVTRALHLVQPSLRPAQEAGTISIICDTLRLAQEVGASTWFMTFRNWDFKAYYKNELTVMDWMIFQSPMWCLCSYSFFSFLSWIKCLLNNFH